MTLREANETADHVTLETLGSSVGAGIAHIRHVDLVSAGDPEPFDRTTVSPTPIHGVSGQDGGLSISADHSTSAAVPLSDPANAAMQTEVLPPDHGAALIPPAKAKRARGGSTLSEPANVPMDTAERPQARGVAQFIADDQLKDGDANLSDPSIQELDPSESMSDRGGGHAWRDTHDVHAPAKKTRKAKVELRTEADTPTGGDVQPSHEPQSGLDVAVIVDVWRQRVDLKRAAGRLNLQALAVCRRACEGDKDAAQKAWGQIQKGKGDPDLATVVEPYRQAMAGLEHSAGLLEKHLAKLVRKHPLWTWADGVRGLGELSVAGLIGEASGNLGDYKSVSALWKRFGLAVIEGERQRRVAGAEAALIHGYAPQRRAFAYVVSCNLMKSQKAEDEYRQLYDRRKAYELNRDIPKAHAHNRALRVMVKELLKDAWAADRRLRAA